ncbi:MAG: PIG-L deacetylase family protein [Acidimicrobiales bacterium]
MDEPSWGEVDPNLLRRVVVVSPHFDDAVLGASYLLARHPGSAVLTVFGGRPGAYPDEPTEWDASGGFASGDDVVGSRREEDRLALAVLGAEQFWLEFVDYQYDDPRSHPRPRAVAPELLAAVERLEASAVFLPTGLGHPDHVVTHDAGLLVREERPDLAWFCYQEAGYAQLPGLLAWRVSKLLRAGIWPTPSLVPIAPDRERKQRAVWSYTSQIGPLDAVQRLSRGFESGNGEQFWQLAPPPEGWEGLVELD